MNVRVQRTCRDTTHRPPSGAARAVAVHVAAAPKEERIARGPHGSSVGVLGVGPPRVDELLDRRVRVLLAPLRAQLALLLEAPLPVPLYPNVWKTRDPGPGGEPNAWRSSNGSFGVLPCLAELVTVKEPENAADKK